ncbi:TPA: glycosyltransferase family 25 protein, partial [Haemophilus influenzae]
LETFLQPVKLEKQTKIPPFNSRNFDILKSTHWGTAGYIISQGAAKYVIEYLKNIPSDEIVAVDELIFNKLVDVDNYIVYQLNPAICIQELQANQSKSVLTSGLEKERQKRSKIRKKKTLKQRLTRIKENIIRALNRKKWKEQQRIKEMQGKEIVRFM